MERLIFDVFSFTIKSHIFSDSVGENALNVLHTLQQQTGILQPPFLPSTGECIELVLKFVNYIYEFHGLVMLADQSCIARPSALGMSNPNWEPLIHTSVNEKKNCEG